jgi:hypothetical protein
MFASIINSSPIIFSSIFKALITRCIEELSATIPINTNISTNSSSSSGYSNGKGNTAAISDSILTAVYRYLCGYGKITIMML